MKLVVNGEDRTVPDETSVSDLIGLMDLESRGVAIAVDNEVVTKSLWQEFKLAEGQRVEIVRAVQGGSR